MTDNNAQPGYSDQLLHPADPEGPIPEDIMEWIRANPDALYVSIPGKYIGREPSYWAGAMRMYRQQLPALHSLEQSIIQRDHNWKRIYDQLQEREKEAADLKESLNHAAQLVKTDRAMITTLKTEIVDYRKALEEIKTKGTSFDGTQIIYTQGAVIAMKIIDQYPHTT